MFIELFIKHRVQIIDRYGDHSSLFLYPAKCLNLFIDHNLLELFRI
jgi:hypothetical protein